nr:ATP-dependent 6-phosphofructokinase 4, chloroplastic [Ipomoea batatas]
MQVLSSSRGFNFPATKPPSAFLYWELVIGGDGTQKGAAAIFKEVTERGLTVAVAGIPKTIDNDIAFVVLDPSTVPIFFYYYQINEPKIFSEQGKCRGNDGLGKTAYHDDNQAENAISFTDSASNDIIWFQCRHVIKGLASRTST